MSKYLIVWKYKIKPEYQGKFEFEYGSSGTWNSIFSKSKNYIGSFLHKSETDSDSYLLIDFWTNKEFYENFKESYNLDYHKLSTKFAYLYESEEKIGTFYTIE